MQLLFINSYLWKKLSNIKLLRQTDLHSLDIVSQKLFSHQKVLIVGDIVRYYDVTLVSGMCQETQLENVIIPDGNN